MSSSKQTKGSASADDVAASVSRLKQDLADVIEEASSLLSGAASNTARQSVERARGTYEESVGHLKEGVGYATERVSHLTDEAGAEIRRHPFAAVGITLGVGLIFGSLLTLTNRRSR